MASPAKRQRSANRESQLQETPDSKTILSEKDFHRMIRLEEKRSRRTQRPFALMLMNTGQALPAVVNNLGPLPNILSVLQANTREIDQIGWYETNATVGAIFTEITVGNDLILGTILSRINTTLKTKLTPEQFNRIKGWCIVLPEELGRIHPVGKMRVGLPLTYAASVASLGWGPPTE